MGTPDPGLKDCPSCGSRIAEAADLCPLCTAELGRCSTCRAWLVAGAACARCGKGTAIRKQESTAVPKPVLAAGPEGPKMLFQADPFPLLPLLLLRMLLVAALCGAVVLALAASELGPVTRFVRQYGSKPRIGWPVLWASAAGFLVLVGVSGSMIRRFRMKHTQMLGQPVTLKLGIGAMLMNVLLTVFFVPLTAGVGWPWFHARFRQAFYQNCILPTHGGRRLGFQGTGGEVLARLGLSALLFPLGVATGGLLFGLIAWIWVKWEQSSLLVPDRTGHYRPVEFFGSRWGYLWRWMGGWLLSLLTVGIYRPWAKAAEWRWIAAHTQVF